jgi:hypothetical protein
MFLLSWTHFRWYRECRVPFSCFALQEAFPAVPRASGLVFMFCAPGLIFGGTEGVRFRFHVLRERKRFRRYRGRPVSFSCFALLDMFFAVPSASGPVVMFCAPELIFCGPEGNGFHFQVSRAETSFWRYRGCRVAFSFFPLPNSF